MFAPMFDFLLVVDSIFQKLIFNEAVVKLIVAKIFNFFKLGFENFKENDLL
jgi:hypothetical protein